MIGKEQGFHLDPKDLVINGIKTVIAVGLGFGGYALYTVNNNASAETPTINTLVNSVNSFFYRPSYPREIPYPDIPEKPYVSVNYEQKTFEYGPQKIKGEKVAGVFIESTKRVDKDKPIKETVQFNLVRQNGALKIDPGDKVLREISISRGLDHYNKKVILGIQYPITDSQNTEIGLKSLIEVELDEIPPSEPLLVNDLLNDPREKLRITFEKVSKITVYGNGRFSIILDKQFMQENPATSRALFNLFNILFQLGKYNK